MLATRRGFSLIIVLLISLVGLAVIGAVMNVATVNTGAGMTASTINRNYNLLVSEAEKARSWIIASLDKGLVPGGGAIRKAIMSPEELLVEELVGSGDVRTLSPKEMGLYGVGGNSGIVTLRIYNMQYDNVSEKMNPADIQRLPPSMMLPADYGDKNFEPVNDASLGNGGGGSGGESGSGAANAGAYLIRASLEIDGVPSSTVELALIGAAADDVKK
jgi:hypothetical protein